MKEPLAVSRGLTSRVCRGCSLLCDDVKIGRSAAGELEFDGRLCELGARFAQTAAASQLDGAARLNGKAVSTDSCLDTLTAWLQEREGQRLFAGMEHLTSAGQRQLVRVVEAAGGWIGAPLSGVGPSEMALTRHGRSTASLGEFRQSPGLAVLVAEQGDFVPPRLFDRFVHPESSRWVIGSWNSAPGGAQSAGVWNQIEASPEEVLKAIRLLRSAASEGPGHPGGRADSSEWRGLFQAVETSSSLVVFTAARIGVAVSAPDPVVDGLHQWIQALNRLKPAALVPLDAAGNSASAAGVLAWSWGLASGGAVVNGDLVCPAGYESAARRIVEGNYDVLLWIDGADSGPPSDLLDGLKRRGNRRLAVLASRKSPVADLADLLLPVAEPGWDDGGDFWRLDEVPLRLDQLAPCQRLRAPEVLSDIADRLTSAKSNLFPPPPATVPVHPELLRAEGPGEADKTQKKGER